MLQAKSRKMLYTYVAGVDAKSPLFAPLTVTAATILQNKIEKKIQILIG